MRAVSRLYICLTTEEKARKILSQGSVLSSAVFSGLLWPMVRPLKTLDIIVPVIFKFTFGGVVSCSPGTPPPSPLGCVRDTDFSKAFFTFRMSKADTCVQTDRYDEANTSFSWVWASAFKK